ncbi:transposase [Escherichia coli]
MARLQRQLSRKVKFSNNWQKQKRKIQRLHSRIANIRRDYLHKVTRLLAKTTTRAIEDLKVSNMSKSAAGTVSQPGGSGKIRFKPFYNWIRGWYEMLPARVQAALWRGGQVLAVPPALRVLWSYSEIKSPVTKSIQMPGMWIYSERRCKRRS